MVAPASPYLVHGHVECRSGGQEWWCYAQPVLQADVTICSLIIGANDESERSSLLGVPTDASKEVRDDYTFRVAGTYAFIGDDRTLDVTIARRLVESGFSRPWPTKEPFERITDPSLVHATWMNAQELARVFRLYEHVTSDLVPAACCALLSMMRALERDYEVRFVVWFEVVAPTVLVSDSERSSGGMRAAFGPRRITSARKRIGQKDVTA